MGKEWKLGWEHQTHADKGKQVIKRYLNSNVTSKKIPKGDKNVLVREGECVVYYRDGKIYDVLGPGRHRVDDKFFLVTDYVFVDMGRFMLKFGIPEGTILTQDKVPLSAYGNITIQINDPKNFLTNVVAGEPEFYEADMKKWAVNKIVSIMRAELSKLTSMAVYTERETFISICRVKSKEMFEDFGFKFLDLNLEGVKLPDKVENALSERAASLAGAEAEVARLKMIQEAGINVLDLEKIKAVQELAKRKGGGVGSMYDSTVIAGMVGPIGSGSTPPVGVAVSGGTGNPEIQKIKDMMTKLDDKLLMGEISEQKHTEMMERLKKRLQELGG
ncbi:MAG: SPFH domain-containing protein [Candidatus Helarchaeota archaeon]